jgi:hypothetical protein
MDSKAAAFAFVGVDRWKAGRVYSRESEFSNYDCRMFRTSRGRARNEQDAVERRPPGNASPKRRGQRWTAAKRESGVPAGTAKPVAKKPKRKLSAEGRQRIIGSAKKRWATVRTAASKAAKSAAWRLPPGLAIPTRMLPVAHASPKWAAGACRDQFPLLTSAARSGGIAPSSVRVPGQTADLPR